MESKKSGHLGGWYLAPIGISGDECHDLHLAFLLNGWLTR